MSDTLLRLVKPFDPRYIAQLPGKGGGDYVTHSVVEQRLLSVLGIPPDIRVVRELYDGETLTGCVLSMSVFIDERYISVEEAGEADNPQSKTNGARLKDAISDAYKRCAMRLGVGLHLWAQDSFFLYESMRARADAVQSIQTAQSVGAPTPGSPAAGPATFSEAAAAPATTSGEAEASTTSQVSGDDPSPPDATVGASERGDVATPAALAGPKPPLGAPAPATVVEAAAPDFGEGSVAAAASPLHTFTGEWNGPCEVCHWLAEAPIHIVPTRARA